MADTGERVGVAIALTLLAILLFDGMGLVIKLLSDRYTASELSAWRNLFGLLPSALALWSTRAWHRQGRPLRIRQWQLAAGRGICVTFAQLAFYYSLGQLAFATANTITYCNALFMTALAVPLLGERVGALRWGAVAIGFVGVVLVIGPGRDSFTPAALAPLAAAFLYALAGILARKIDPGVPSPLINLHSNLVAAFGATLLCLTLGGFSPFADPTDIAWLAAMGGFGGLAVLCLTVSFRMTEQSNLAPFTYFGVVTAFVLGWLFFDEAPWGDLFPGALLIVLGGGLVIWRERRRART